MSLLLVFTQVGSTGQTRKEEIQLSLSMMIIVIVKGVFISELMIYWFANEEYGAITPPLLFINSRQRGV